jgi:hypothetical protein
MTDATRALYDQLAAHFDEHSEKPGGGSTKLIFVTGEQVIARLNDVLGPDAWEFEVQESQLLPGPPLEAVVRGRLTVHFATRTVVREQWGSQPVQGKGELGNIYKGATTDALKKCASLVGVGLYLFDAEEREAVRREMVAEQRTGQASRPAATAPDAPLVCTACEAPLTSEVKFKDGTVWTPAKLAEFGRSKYGRVLCMACYRDAKAAASLN